ncbi:MAG: alpha-2-macroglobulin family protein [Betaproteobacteria bacterium]|nr:alpha-2-macroglobulin family protein [Betaproteobacteria bacterium]
MLSQLINKKILAIVGIAFIALLAWWFGQSRNSGVGEAVAGEPFAAIDCQARYFENTPALALMFTVPLDTRQNFSERLSVIDLGEVKERSGRSGKPSAENAPQPPAEETPKGTAVTTAWVVGDNPRIAYLPHTIPLHRYRVTLKPELASSSKEVLGKTLACDITAQEMPPAYYFASKGTVLPAKQNGGLPVVTVNVPEVDIQFLRVEPAQLPRFMEYISGRRAKATENRSEDSDNEDYDYGDYGQKPSAQGMLNYYSVDSLTPFAKSVYLGRFITDARENRRNTTHIPVEDISELQQPGIYIAVMSQPGRFRAEFQTTYFYVSDIGIHARRYTNALEVYATSLKNGRALAGTEFELLDENGKSLGRADADSDGRARFTLKTPQARIITAKRGAEFSLLSLIQPALDLSEFDISGHLARPVKIFAYAGRDLYRPGETFDVGVLVRDSDGKPIPPAPITATLKRADGKVVQQFTLKPEANKPGYLQKNLVLPQDAQTGTWALEFRADPAAKAADHTLKIRVEEFLPERLKLDLKAEKPYLAPGDNFTLDVQGDYLYGAPAAGNRVLAVVNTERQRIPFPKEWPGFEFGDINDDSLKTREEIPAIDLADDGSGSLEIPLTKARNQSPLSIRATVSLLESGGRPVVRSLERTLWPADKMIGIRPLWSGSFAREGAPAEVEIIRVNREGKFAPLPKGILRVYREDRDYYWVNDDARGWHYAYNEGNELVESREFDLTKRSKISFPTRWGRYRVEVADRETGQTARYRFYVGWGAEGAEAIGSRPDRVQLRFDKDGYQPGDTAKLTLTPPHDGEALIVVEGDQALYQKRVSVAASGTTVEIPIGRDWNRHDLYLTAVVFRPGSRSDKITPARALGLSYLPINSDTRRLAVKLTAPAKIEPDSPLKVKIKIDGLKNEAGLVTLSAVDVGILNITRYSSPDAFDFFLGKQRYQADLLDLYGKLIETVEGSKGKLKFGGDANLREAPAKLKKVKLVDLFSGPVMTNAQGEADITLNVPDFNGTLRLMAVAAGANQFGKAEAEVVSAASIVAELSTPRFISPGDRAAVALDVTNTTAESQSIKVTLGSRGPLKLAGLNETLTLKPQQKKTLRTSVETTDAAGQGVLTVTVTGGKAIAPNPQPINIQREAVLEVTPLSPLERTRRYTRVAPGESLKLDSAQLEGYYSGSALISTTFSSTPPINIGELVKGLLQYPYGCLEQTTSRAFPHLLIDEATANRFSLKSLTTAQREKAISDALSRLAGMQRASGAFSLWGGEGGEEPWLTAYVVDFFKTAREAGYAVPETLTKRADEWMLKQLQQAGSSFPAKPTNPKKDTRPDDAITRDSNWWNEYRNRDLGREGHRRLGALAYMGYVLAKDERAPLSALRTLHDTYRDRALSPLPLVHLGLALKRMGDDKRATSAFDAAFAIPYGMTGYEWEWLGDYGTRLRDTALAYALLEKNQIAHPRKDNLLAELIEQLPRARWLSTQEQMALLQASQSVGGGKGEGWQLDLQGAAPVESLASKTTEMREFDAAQVKRGVSLTNTGKEPLFVAIEASGYPQKTAETKSDLVQLRRTLYNPDGTTVGERALKVGEQLLVHVEVTAKRRIEDGMVVDRVPAGLEIENLNLSQGSRLNDFKTPAAIPDSRPGYGRRTLTGIAESLSDERIKHREFRDDRFVVAARLEGVLDLYYLVRVVTPGQFVVPPSFAEDMYRPEVRGLAAGGGSLTVVERK